MTDAASLRFDPAFGGVEYLHASYSAHVFDMHAHAEYVVSIVDEGAEAFRCRGENHVAPAGAIYTINPGETHDGRAAGVGWRYRALYPSVEFVERALGKGAARAFARVVWRDEACAALLSALHELLVHSECSLAKQSAMVSALERLFAINSRQGGAEAPTWRENNRLNLVREILCERYSERLTLEALGAEVGLHPSYLLSAFKRRFGVSPAAFLRSERLKRAKALMRAGRPLRFVALEAGFYDQAHFSRCFKRAFGASPAAYAGAFVLA